MKQDLTRRGFVGTAGAAALAPAAFAVDKRPAILGGPPACTATFPSWPIHDAHDERALADVVKSGCWFRGNGQNVTKFEQAYARLTGAKACVTTVNGTNALYIGLNALGVEPGDEVLVSPFTFVATVNVILRQHVLPVFVDTDPETFQLNPAKMEALITPRTKAILPVHIGGSTADMDGVMAVARKHKLAVIEDACQAWNAEWREKNVGRLGDCGCFSFQASKNLTAGEGGAIVSDDPELIERAYAFHSQGRRRRPGAEPGHAMSGSNLRMTEFQAALLLAQLTRFEEQARQRSENAAYLTKLLEDVPGVTPARMYGGCTRNAYHLYMIRYDKERFAGMPRAQFLAALAAEGAPFKAGYGRLNEAELVANSLKSRGYQRLFSAERLARWREQNELPGNNQACEEACWTLQWTLLGSRSAMEQIADAFRKVQRNAGEIAKKLDS